MSTLDITRSYSNNAILTEAMLDNIKTGVEDFLNTTKLNADNIQDGVITSSSISSGAVTRAKRAAANIQVSSAATQTVSTSTLTAITNLTCTITTVGGPLLVGLTHLDTTNPGYIKVSYSGYIVLKRGSTTIRAVSIGADAVGSSLSIPPGCVTYIDTPDAGTYTYTVEASGISSILFNNCKLVVTPL